MSLPAWNRKAPARAVVATALSALTVFGASSVAVADINQQVAQGYGQPAFGYGFQGQPAPYGPAFGYGQQPSFGAPGYPPVQPSSTLTAPVPAQGYGAGVQDAPVPQPAPGYGMPQPFPGYGPGFANGFSAPFGGGGFGFDPYAGFGQEFGFGYGPFAPSEPNYAPAEPEKPAAAEPASVATAPAPAAPAPVQTVTVPAETVPQPVPVPSSTVSASSDYSYEIAPATGSTYVGTSTQIGSAPATYEDPYRAIQPQAPAPAPAPQTVYEPLPQPSYTLQYEAQPAPAPAPSYVAPEPPAPVQRYTVAPQPAPQPVPQAIPQIAPAPQQGTVVVGGYEYQAAPVPAPVPQQGPDYYDLSAQSAAAAAAVVAAPPPSNFEVAAFAPAQPVAPRSGFFVQVGAFLDPNRANNLVNSLASGGQQAFIIPAQVRGKLYHRVRIAAGDRRSARAIRDQVRELGYYEARVVKG